MSKTTLINEANIRTIIENQAEAIRQKNVSDALANYAEGVISFDVIDPLKYTGLYEVRTRLTQWFSSFRDSAIGYEVSDLKIFADENAAFSHCLCHVSAFTADGSKLDMWWRQTACYSRTNGHWEVTHVHSSVPFNVESGKASLDLKPS